MLLVSKNSQVFDGLLVVLQTAVYFVEDLFVVMLARNLRVEEHESARFGAQRGNVGASRHERSQIDPHERILTQLQHFAIQAKQTGHVFVNGVADQDLVVREKERGGEYVSFEHGFVPLPNLSQFVQLDMISQRFEQQF